MSRSGKAKKPKMVDGHLIQTRQKAEVWFALYYIMGTDRSIDGLADYGHKVGMQISRTTLARYSRQYKWQDRVAALDEQLQQDRDLELAELVQKMNENQMQIGRGFGDLVKTGLQRYTEYLSKNPDKRLSPQSMSILASTGTKIERLAAGEATDRIELRNNIVNVIIPQIVNLFYSINDLEDPDKRTQQFALGAQRIIDQTTKDFE